MGVVDFLLGKQPRTLFDYTCEALIGQVSDLMGRFSAADFIPRASDLRFRLFDSGLRPRYVVLHLRDLNRRQRLTLPNVIPHVDADLLHVTGDFGHEIYFLEWDEFSRKNDLVRKILYPGL